MPDFPELGVSDVSSSASSNALTYVRNFLTVSASDTSSTIGVMANFLFLARVRNFLK